MWGEQTINENYNFLAQPYTKQVYTSCPQKSGVLVSNFNFERNVAVKLRYLSSFESLFIQLSKGVSFVKFAQLAGELCLFKWSELEN